MFLQNSQKHMNFSTKNKILSKSQNPHFFLRNLQIILQSTLQQLPKELFQTYPTQSKYTPL